MKLDYHVFRLSDCNHTVKKHASATLFGNVLVRRMWDNGVVEFLVDGPSGWSVTETFEDPSAVDESVPKFGTTRQLQADTLVLAGTLITGGTQPWVRLGVYHREAGTWVRKALIEEPAHTTTGYRVALDGDWLAIASDRQPQVKLYHREGDDWVDHTLLQPAHEGTGFGAAIALDRDTLVVGEPFGPTGDYEDPGQVAVYRYDGSTWKLDEYVLPPIPEPSAQWGSSVALSDNLLVVGALGNTDYVDPGRVDVLRRLDSSPWGPPDTYWGMVGAWGPEQPWGSDGTGGAVAVHGATVLASAAAYYEEGGDSGNQPPYSGGRVYVFDIPPLDQDDDGFDESVDCADLDPDSYPGAPELLDGLDNDCDGFVDEEISEHGDTADSGAPQGDPGEPQEDTGLEPPDASEDERAPAGRCGCRAAPMAPMTLLALLSAAAVARRRR